MAYDKALAERIRGILTGRTGITEKRMFGGLAFFLNGHICVGVWKDSLIGRLGADGAEAALRDANVKPFDITGSAMKGWVLVSGKGIAEDDQLAEWIEQALAFVATLPAK